MNCLRQITKALIFLSVTGAAPAIFAQQIYKCVKDGRTTFQSAPCEGGSVSSTPPPVRAVASRLPWEGLRQGISPDEVRRNDSAVETMGGGRAYTLHKPGVMIAGILFDAKYFFDESTQLVSMIVDKAADVKVGLLQLGANEANFAALEKLESFFRNKYGTETSRDLKNKESGFPGLSARSTWEMANGKFSIVVIPITATTSTLTLNMKFGGRS